MDKIKTYDMLATHYAKLGGSTEAKLDDAYAKKASPKIIKRLNNLVNYYASKVVDFADKKSMLQLQSEK